MLELKACHADNKSPGHSYVAWLRFLSRCYFGPLPWSPVPKSKMTSGNQTVNKLGVHVPYSYQGIFLNLLRIDSGYILSARVDETCILFLGHPERKNIFQFRFLFRIAKRSNPDGSFECICNKLKISNGIVLL